MSVRVSIVIPALGDTALLERNLPPLFEELEANGGLDEVVLVDDTGEDVLAPWALGAFPAATQTCLRVVSREENGGFGKALLDGARVARGEFMFAMNPDMRVHSGFLTPLVEAMSDEAVFAASPRVWIAGDETRCESRNSLQYSDGRLRVVARPPGAIDEPGRIPFAIGGAMLLRRAEFLEGGGFDPLFEPFYWEDVDLCLGAWRRGMRVVEIPQSIVEHHNRGTVGAVVPDELIQAAIEKNRHLTLWKHMGTRGEAHDNLCALWRDALDAAMAGRRDELIWLALALQELPRVGSSRAALGHPALTLEAGLRASSPAD